MDRKEITACLLKSRGEGRKLRCPGGGEGGRLGRGGGDAPRKVGEEHWRSPGHQDPAAPRASDGWRGPLSRGAPARGGCSQGLENPGVRGKREKVGDDGPGCLSQMLPGH